MTPICTLALIVPVWADIFVVRFLFNDKAAAMSMVLVTGGSGFIGSHSILQLLALGHQVRTTVRSLKREGDVRAMLKNGGALSDDQLQFIAADLEKDAGWPEAVAGCDYVLHVASPFPQAIPKNEDELIVPARRHVAGAAPPGTPGSSAWCSPLHSRQSAMVNRRSKRRLTKRTGLTPMATTCART